MRRMALWIRKHALISSLVAAASLRLVAAWCSYGWFTRDDYQLGIEQAYAWLHHTGASFAYDFRSPILTWGCMPFIALGEACGITDRAHLVRCMHLGWGLFSLLAIPPVFATAKRSFGDTVAAIAAWLMAGYAIMPTISCRAMIEVVAIVPLAWALLYIDRARGERRFGSAFKGALALCVATLIRFQLGLLFIAAAWVLRRQGRRTWLGLVLGAAVGVALQCLCDWSFGRAALATPLAYLRFNLTYASTFGTSPWYTYLLNFVLWTVPPATFALGKPLWLALMRQPWISAIFVVFVGVHSWVGHKEDRFMFSLLPMFFIVLASALHQAWHGQRWQRASVLAFAGINAVALGVTIASDTYRSVNAPLVYLSRHAPRARLASVGFLSLPTYYLGDKAQLRMFGDLQDLQRQSPESLAQLDYVWLRGPVLDEAIAQVSDITGQRCREVTLFAGDFADRILVRVNHHNVRRSPTALIRCGPPVPTGLQGA